VVPSSEKAKFFPAALAFIDAVILNPIFSGTELRFQLFPKFLPHLRAIIILFTIII
jgi:hypothetical protein